MIFLIVRFLGVFFIVTLLGCTSSTSNNSVVTPPIIQLRPDFILATSPRESTHLPITIFERYGMDARSADIWEDISGYDSLVCLKVETSRLAQNGDDFIEPTKVQERISILVDDAKVGKVYVTSILLQSIHVIDANGEYLMTGIEPKLICGEVDLSVGVHKVLFQFRQTSGDVLEYEWLFELVDE